MMMHPSGNEEIAWLRLQDLQREAENRRLTARPSATMAAIHRLFARASAAIQPLETGAQPAVVQGAECLHHA